MPYQSEEIPPDSTVNILLVDDHPENLLALEAILEGLNLNLVKANSGEQALKCLLKQDFALILLDVQMPGMDGFEAASLIRQRKRSQYTPIIFLTAFSTSDDLVFKGYALGAVDYLFKPLNAEILKSKVAVFVELFKKTEEVKRQATQLVAVNAELSEREARFRSLSACSPVGIFLTDIQGRCTYTNPRCEAICGFTQQESLGIGWSQLVRTENSDKVMAEWSKWTLEGQEYSQEFCFQIPEETPRWVHIRISPMGGDRGEMSGHVGTIEDITQRKQAEEARAQVIQEQAARQQAQEENRRKDEFLATLSHELRTPLNSMLGWAHLLRTRSFDQPTIIKGLETIERNARLQTQLVEDLLDVSRMIRGNIQLNVYPVNLASLVQNGIDSIRPAAEAKGITVESFVDDSLELIPADQARLQQIVWNLLSNAIKFTHSAGKVQVRLERAGTNAQLKISDTGMGIPLDVLPYIFDRFRQADSSSTRSYGGLGLGLAIVRHLVELHGGTVCAESLGEEQGATFTVLLPLVAEDNKNSQPSDLEDNYAIASDQELLANASKVEGLRVLLVEDEADTRQLLVKVLEVSGAEVTAVASVSEALASLEHSRPDVLVSDIGMPIEDGYALIRKVRSLDGGSQHTQIPAVALTAYASEQDQSRAISSGFQMHVSKPVEPDELISAIATLVGRSANSYRKRRSGTSRRPAYLF